MSLVGVIFQKDNYQKYLLNYCQKFAQDGLLHLEVRMTLGAVFGDDLKNLSSEEHIGIYEHVQNIMQ